MPSNSPPEEGVDSLPPYELDAAITRPLMPPSTRSQTHPAFEHAHGSLNLPSNYFIIRSRAPRGRCFDVLGHRSHHGAEVGLHPVKEPVLRGSDDLQLPQNNQVFFLGWDGTLYSASASRPLDASLEEGLSICIQRPIMAIPSHHSHPLPRFRLDPSTSVLLVEFGTDPSYPGPSTSTAWRDDYDYIVEAVPKRRKRAEETSVWASASSGLASASKELIAGLGQLGDATPRALVAGFGETLGGMGDKLGGLGLFSKSAPNSPRLGDGPPRPPPKPALSPVASSSRHPDSPLPSPPPDSDDSDSDSEPSAYRPLRVIRLPRTTWREKLPQEVLQRPHGRSSPQLGLAPTSTKELRKWRRRQWEVIPIVVRPKAVDGILPPPPLASTHLSIPRWSDLAPSAGAVASRAGGLVSSISNSLSSPRASTDDDTFIVDGDGDALAVDSSEIERCGRSRPESPSLVPLPLPPVRFESPLPSLPSPPSMAPLAVEAGGASDPEVAPRDPESEQNDSEEVATEGNGKVREAALA